MKVDVEYETVVNQPAETFRSSDTPFTKPHVQRLQQCGYYVGGQ